MTIPVFSIIITAFNQQSKITETIDSVLSQSFSDYEIIIVDDGSTDNTYDVIKKIAANNNKIKIVKHENNKSTFQSRMSGIKAATGQYTLFIDGDDSLLKDALLQLDNDVIEKEDFDICEFSYMKIDTKEIIEPYSGFNEK